MKLRLFLLSTFVLSFVYAKEKSPGDSSTDATEEIYSSFRLPSTLEPIHYLVRLQPLLYGNFSILGHVQITFSVLKPTNQIYLHMTDIATKSDTVKVYEEGKGKDPQMRVVSQDYDPSREFYIATLKSEMAAGNNYTISMDFEGLLNDLLVGFYRLFYTNEFGENVTMAATQFQPTDARRAFPCFDEPALKATFTINLAREEAMSSISNMPQVKTEPLEGQPGWVVDFYETSVPMPTYLVAFVVSDFENLSSNASDTFDFRVWARPKWVEQVRYALDVGPKIMNFFGEFFNVTYKLPKQDMIAVPDMAGWAMENWGLVTYREFEMLHHPEQANAEHLMRISTVIAHELSHQWFGNLVTPLWWTDLWLNEGFASYMENFGMNGVDPELHLLQLIVARYMHYAFELDCLKTSHPISVPVGHPAEIIEIFDVISYQKGASIIRMMHHFLRDSFREGLSQYLKDKSFDNAEQDDLWLYLTREAHRDRTLSRSLSVKEIMDTWTLQMGFPVLTATLNDNGSALISQKRFLLHDNPQFADEHDYKWWIPLTYTSQDNPDFDQTQPEDWMMPTETEKVLENVTSPGNWTIFNLKETGYYRVNYDVKNWQALIEQLSMNHSVIDPINRAQLVDDSLNLARSGDMPYDTSLNLLSYLEDESNFIPIKAALRGMGYLVDMTYHYNDPKRQNDYDMLKNYFVSLLSPIYEETGFDDIPTESNLDQMKRSKVLSWMCHLNEPSCVNQSIALFSQWMSDPDNFTIISPNQKEAVFCTAIANGGDLEWDFAWDRYLNADFSREKILLLQALGCSSNEKTLVEYLNRALSPNRGIKKQDLEVVMGAVASTATGKVTAWNFVRENWKTITDFLGTTSLTLRIIMESFTKFLHTPAHHTELKSFKAKHTDQFWAATRAIKQAEEIVMTNIHWRENYYPQIITWLKNKGFGWKNSSEDALNLKM